MTRCRCTYHEEFVHVTCLYAVIMVQASATEKFRKVVEAYEAHRKRRQIMLKGCERMGKVDLQNWREGRVEGRLDFRK